MMESLIRTFLLVFAIFAFTILAIELLPNIPAYKSMYSTYEFVAFSNNFKRLLDYCVSSASVASSVELRFEMPREIQQSQIFINCSSEENTTVLTIATTKLKKKMILPAWIRCSFAVTSGRQVYLMNCKRLNNKIYISIQ
jgi:hypothetical protein